jgi:hypothetical protein
MTQMGEGFWRRAIRTRRGPTCAALLALLAATATPGVAPARPAPEPAWVRISYRELLDPKALTHSGDKLADALRKRGNRGELQPFLDPYSSLLGYAVQMLAGADPAPQASLAEPYPAGAAQPAWAALLRAGRYAVSTDGQGRARVFVPGDDPRAAYRRAYPLLRHPLGAALVPGVPLDVEVYAYRNDYAAAELRLNPRPYRFRARAFPPQGRALDLAELEAFFRQGGRLEGAELEPGGGLVLFASRQEQQRLGGEAISLADLAVAYRAVFHAGDAEVFVSLDPSPDPTLAAVNFGGLLEDTRIGAAVLAADVRFKTVCTGLDPGTFEDVREKTRRAVPSFMTNAERRFSTDATPGLSQWVFARYWYYPDSCGVESDDDDRLAAITRDQLTADVERLEPGAGTARRKRPPLPAYFRQNIRELNQNYARYAAVFPEYRDLSSAARLMALAAWLGRVRPEGLDLDGLLAVTLPPGHTPRTVPQLLSAEILESPGPEPRVPGQVLRSTRVRHLTPELDRKVSEFFGDPWHLAVFLAYKAGKGPADAPGLAAEAGRLLPTVQDEPVRTLLKSPGDLQAFLHACADRLLGDAGRTDAAAATRDLDRLQRLRDELAALPPAAAQGDEDPARQRLEREMGEIVRSYHAQGRTPAAATVVTAQYVGGVSLSPRQFTVSKSAARPALEKLKAATRAAGTGGGAAGWIRSSSRQPAARSATALAPAAGVVRAAPHQDRRAPAGPPRPQAVPHGGAGEEQLPPRPAAQAMGSIAVPGSASPGGTPLVGRLGAGGRIVFTRAAR